ncbi:MAG: hypothetical protein ACXW5U_12020 [Thermoanaerobaculia bacterium]
MKRAEGWLVPLLLVVLTAAVHGAVVRQWWLWDDPQLLYGALQHRFVDLLTWPEVWRTQSSTNFVPLLLGAFEADLSLFGLAPEMFYVHHLLVFALAIAAIYAYARTWTRPVVAGVAAAAVALSPSSYTVAALLMDRHYAEGLLLALCALLLFRASEKRPLLALAGAAVYLLASLEKEVFVPLPLLVIAQDFVSRRPWRVLFRDTFVSGCVTLAYVGWRIFMLGSFGGYGRGRQGWELVQLPREVWTKAVGFEGAAAVATALVAAVILFYALRRAPLAAVVAVTSTAVVVFVPLVALRVLDHRYVFVATAALLILGAAATGASSPRSVAFAAFVVFAVLVVVGGLRERPNARASLARMEAQGRYLWTAPATAPPLLTAPNGWYTEGIRWLRRSVKREEAPRAIASIPGLVLSGIDPRAVRLLDRTPEELAASYALVARDFDPQIPIQVEISRRDQTLHWRLAPHESGVRWFYVAMPSYELLELDAVAWTRYPTHLRPPTYEATPEAQHFRIIRMQSGRWNVSRELPWPRDGERYVWSSLPR